MGTDEEIKALQEGIYREKVARARRMTPGERLAAGPDLFEEVADRMRAGVAMGHQLGEIRD